MECKTGGGQQVSTAVLPTEHRPCPARITAASASHVSKREQYSKVDIHPDAGVRE